MAANITFPTSMSEYDFEGRIGRGAFASVYLANCPSKNEKVAIKVIELEIFDKNNEDESKHKNEDENDKNKNRNKNKKEEENKNNENDISWDEIQKEASVMARMNHKNIVRCYTSFCVTTELWLVMPLLIGSCSDIMKSIQEFNHGFIDELIVSTIIRDILSAVQYIHADGRVHRDIKSANILLSSSGLCQISDFGVSGAIIEGGLRKHGRDTFTGSLWWMSPEVLQRENRHSYKADIWSLGITCLELTFGKPPHSKQRPVKVMLTILQSPPPTIQQCINENMNDQHNIKYPKYSKKFKDFLSKTLQKDPNKRASANALLNHSFIKQAKDNQYLFDKIVSKYKRQQYNNNILPNSVAQKIKQQQKLNDKQNGNHINSNGNMVHNGDHDKNIHNDSQIESNGFDFNSEIIHSISHSEAINIENEPTPQNEQSEPETAKKEQNVEKLGRFAVHLSNKTDKDNKQESNDKHNDNNNNNNDTQKADDNNNKDIAKLGRFSVKKIT